MKRTIQKVLFLEDCGHYCHLWTCFRLDSWWPVCTASVWTRKGRESSKWSLIHLFQNVTWCVHWNKNHLFLVSKMSQNQHPTNITTESQNGCWVFSHPSKEETVLLLKASGAHDLPQEPFQYCILLKVAVLPLYSRALSYFCWSPAPLL